MVFYFIQKFFFGQHESQNIYFFCRAKREFFFQNSTLGYMTKTLNQIILFCLHQNQNIFFSNIGNQNIFLEKKPYPGADPGFGIRGHEQERGLGTAEVPTAVLGQSPGRGSRGVKPPLSSGGLRNYIHLFERQF